MLVPIWQLRSNLHMKWLGRTVSGWDSWESTRTLAAWFDLTGRSLKFTARWPPKPSLNGGRAASEAIRAVGWGVLAAVHKDGFCACVVPWQHKKVAMSSQFWRMKPFQSMGSIKSVFSRTSHTEICCFFINSLFTVLHVACQAEQAEELNGGFPESESFNGPELVQFRGFMNYVVFCSSWEHHFQPTRTSCFHGVTWLQVR